MWLEIKWYNTKIDKSVLYFALSSIADWMAFEKFINNYEYEVSMDKFLDMYKKILE